MTDNQVKASVKAKLEEGSDPAKPSGNRNWVQVLSNSLPGVVVALTYKYYFTVSTVRWTVIRSSEVDCD